jgi:curli production assembly/transport component CsgG
LISVQTGEVLLAVSSEKTILSAKVGVSLFTFLDMGTKLLEVEAGLTENESISYAVRKAIEHCVIQVIEEGIKEELWKFK